MLPIPDRPDDGPIHEDAKDPTPTAERLARGGLKFSRFPIPEGSRLTGTVEWVRIDIAEAAEDLDHQITPRRAAQDRDEPPVDGA